MKKNKLFLLLILSIVLMLVFVGCADDTNESEGTEATNGTTEESENNDANDVEEEEEVVANEDWPEELVYAVIPTEDQEDLVSRHEPLANYLTEAIGVPVTIFSGTDYNANIEAMRNGHVHFAYFGPFSYLLARERANAEAFAVHLATPDSNPFYTSQFITLDGNDITSVEDLADKAFAWADPTSTSGYMYPRAHLIDQVGLTNADIDDFLGESFFSGGHEASVLSVLNEDVEAAAISSGSGQRAIENYADHENADRLYVFEATANIPSSPYTYSGDLPEELKERIREAFYNAIDEPSLADYMEEAGLTGGYIPTSHEDYEVVEMTAEKLEMSPEDLLN